MSKGSKLSRNKRTQARINQRIQQPKRTANNKIRKLEKHLANHPNDTQSQESLERRKQ